MAQLNFGGVIENVMTREEFPLEKAREILKDETIAVIGYGVQGPGQACNLRDNGFNVIVGQRPGKTYEKAVADGWVPGETLFGIEEACQKGTIVMCLLSDAAVMSVWPTIKPYLTPGKALYFSHGFAITWNDRTGVVPPKDIDVIMVAPKGSGTSLRTMFLEGRGLNSSYAVYQDATGKALENALAYALAIGGARAGVLETTFRTETETDLFGEQAVLCGGVCALMQAGFETLVEAGYDPRNAYFECIHEMKLIVDLIYQSGFAGMRYSISNTAEYGDYITGPKIVTEDTKKAMKKVLSDIQDGTFAKEFLLDMSPAGRQVHFKAMRKLASEHPSEKVGEEIRKLYSWNNEEDKLVNN